MVTHFATVHSHFASFVVFASLLGGCVTTANAGFVTQSAMPLDGAEGATRGPLRADDPRVHTLSGIRVRIPEGWEEEPPREGIATWAHPAGRAVIVSTEHVGSRLEYQQGLLNVLMQGLADGNQVSDDRVVAGLGPGATRVVWRTPAARQRFSMRMWVARVGQHRLVLSVTTPTSHAAQAPTYWAQMVAEIQRETPAQASQALPSSAWRMGPFRVTPPDGWESAAFENRQYRQYPTGASAPGAVVVMHWSADANSGGALPYDLIRQSLTNNGQTITGEQELTIAATAGHLFECSTALTNVTPTRTTALFVYAQQSLRALFCSARESDQEGQQQCNAMVDTAENPDVVQTGAVR